MSNTMLVSNFKRWLVVMVASLFFFYNFLQVNMLNVIGPYLMHDYNLNSTQLGELSSMYFYGICLFLFPAGVLLDRFSTKRIIIIMMALSIFAMFGFGFAENIYYLSFYRFLMGIAGAFCFLSCMRLASRWFDSSRMALVSGCIVTLAMLGGMVAQTPMSLLCSKIGWTHATLFIAYVGIFLIILMTLVIQDWPSKQEKVKEHDLAEKKHQSIEDLGFWKSITLVASNPYNWLGGLYTAFMNLPIFLLGALWGSLYLTTVKQFTQFEAANIISMIFFGTIIGGPLCGLISDKIHRRVAPMIFGAIASIIVMAVIFMIQSPTAYTFMALFFLLGLLTSTQVLSYPVVTELNPLAVTGSALSIVSFLIMVSGFVFQPFFGYLMDLHLQCPQSLISVCPAIQHVIQTSQYSSMDFFFAIEIMPAAFILSFFIALMIKETHCKPHAHIVEAIERN